ncbi:MAG: ABC transporter ATP-binding protein [Candidatus Eisenbacteria bacterium]|uniref:ABC transporter ATP-binding protein n=1 Tax=Eiseniibacteriota bacterium TaxID=2212470 RepID=A0A948S0F6_UNCEI|nr:ABC transporter ATP-binding protein [Candidatus Eisenbacteria bacterium]
MPSLSVFSGQILGLLGPNGSGKSTLLKVIAGLLPAEAGTIQINGRSLKDYSARERGRTMAYVPQAAQTPFQATVRDVVALGRYPHLGTLGRVRGEDNEKINWAIEYCSLESLEHREIETLSGGERQRVLLARALAQGAPLLLLDEPVSNLDIRYQQETYERLRRLAENEGLGIILADHQINLQSAYCHGLLVLKGGRTAAQGTPAALMSEDLIETVFGLRMRVEQSPEGHLFGSWIAPRIEKYKADEADDR